MHIKIDHDKGGNPFADGGNVSISAQVGKNRGQGLGRERRNVIRIQAHRGDPRQSRALFPGAEFPIENEAALAEFLQALCSVYRTGRGPK